MNTYYIYYHEMGYSFDNEVNTLEKVTYDAFTEIAAREAFFSAYPLAEIWSIDTED